jgi:hypothetical protein
MAKLLSSVELGILEQHSVRGDRIAYYMELADWGYRYPQLALGVVNNDTAAGAGAGISTIFRNGEWVVFDAPGAPDLSIDVLDFIEQNRGNMQQQFDLQ